MIRDIEKLKKQTFDVVVVGAGVYGACVAWDAASRGLKVALIEQNDFGSGTSANSLKIIHGGLRYLQTMDLNRMRQSIDERRHLLKNAAHWVRPLECVMPTYGRGMKGRLAVGAALKLNDFISRDRNVGLPFHQVIPNGRIISKEEMLKKCPGLTTPGLTGGAMWTDAIMSNSDRLTLAFVRMAAHYGAYVSNYVVGSSLHKEDGVVRGVLARDMLSGKDFNIRADFVVNTTGPWLSHVFGLKKVPLTKAFNVVLKKQIIPHVAVGVYKPGQQVKFVTPWRGRSILGTVHLPFEGNPSHVKVSEEEIQTFLNEFNAAYPGSPVKLSDISMVYKGLLPGEVNAHNSQDVKLKKHYEIIDHESEHRVSGAMSVVGVKYTTARGVAEDTVNQVIQKLGKRVGTCQTHNRHVEPVELDYFTDQTKLKEQHVITAIRKEMAIKLSDLMIRRLPFGSVGVPKKDLIQKCADYMGKALEWSPKQKKAEMNEVLAYYDGSPATESKVTKETVPA